MGSGVTRECGWRVGGGSESMDGGQARWKRIRGKLILFEYMMEGNQNVI